MMIKDSLQTPMCSTELCVVAPQQRGQALMRRGIGPIASTHGFSD